MATSVLGAVGALATRWYLSQSVGSLLGSRIELANSFTSMRSTEEGSTLMQLGMSPYTGVDVWPTCTSAP